MKKEDAFDLVKTGNTVYLVAMAYCHTKLIGQRVLEINQSKDLKQFLIEVQNFKESFRQDMQPTRPSDKLLASFYTKALAQTRRFLFKYVQSLPKSCGIISNVPLAQTGT
jgi:hypothetical protein